MFINGIFSPGLAEGNWGPWGQWEACEADCGDSVQYRRRLCNAPAPSHGGRLCDRTIKGELDWRLCEDTGPAGTRTCTGGMCRVE